jgi:hypothetical protein
MSGAAPVDDNALVEQAIARVLEAERAARIAVAEAQSEAAAMADRARAAARAIGERTERRIIRIRARFEERIAAEVAALERAAAGLNVNSAFEQADRAPLARAVAMLAAELTRDRA